MIDLLVLGSGAGGGFPQWNSAAPGCIAARKHDGTSPRTQASAAVSGDGKRWFLFNASPDIRQQINENPPLHPAPEHADQLRHTPIQAVILTCGEIDAVTGLLTLREREPFSLMASRSTLDQLNANPIFGALDPNIVPRVPLELDQPFPLIHKDGSDSGLTLTAFAVPGKAPLYAEAEGSRPDETLGLSIFDGTSTVLFIPGCADITTDIVKRAEQADLLLFDGTLWRNDEMVRAGLSPKTGKRMGHVSVADPDGPIALFRNCTKPQKVLIHINNSNPVLLEKSSEREIANQAGWTIAADGMIFRLETP
ncbi:pyrroloquinoline quinone biosynthesis protein PqqB [Neokomagataea thailandica NBRC 106555]|uniref:Coenzyme PQQ synthesis protein B n=2 Tax=Neokomagataea TaxID=1223423 RepID=A0A4Y6V7X7_9PROT|nr:MULTISPECIES: pyrroloquinoline quinone biosynthesis protein PqqB [Neokomagataea]QDH24656.1 pyrroloquinoline quinone biosynthesis protein PqqB [Neokomagataea tanensis]GBR53923.1 pyrroloquinoline quinone biosynthesis protein PqqB [Neokomagataea thailandica NBRC 106555]